MTEESNGSRAAVIYVVVGTLGAAYVVYQSHRTGTAVGDLSYRWLLLGVIAGVPMAVHDLLTYPDQQRPGIWGIAMLVILASLFFSGISRSILTVSAVLSIVAGVGAAYVLSSVWFYWQARR